MSLALVIGAANVAIRPLIGLLPFPVPLIALALFYLVLNGIMLKAATILIPGITAAGSGGLVIAALLAAIGGVLLFALAGRSGQTRKG